MRSRLIINSGPGLHAALSLSVLVLVLTSRRRRRHRPGVYKQTGARPAASPSRSQVLQACAGRSQGVQALQAQDSSACGTLGLLPSVQRYSGISGAYGAHEACRACSMPQRASLLTVHAQPTNQPTGVWPCAPERGEAPSLRLFASGISRRVLVRVAVLAVPPPASQTLGSWESVPAQSLLNPCITVRTASHPRHERWTQGRDMKWELTQRAQRPRAKVRKDLGSVIFVFSSCFGNSGSRRAVHVML